MHTLKATADTVHWGFFSKDLKPKLTIDSGDIVNVEMLSHHAGDDPDLMIMSNYSKRGDRTTVDLSASHRSTHSRPSY